MTGRGDTHEPAAPERRVLYGRRKGRRLRAGQVRLVERLLPRLEFVPPASGPLDVERLFGRDCPELWLEIGFGAGEHLAAQARAHPDACLIGCEPFLNGVARLLARIEADGLANIRIFRDDARVLLRCLAEASLANVFILFPDPWPKARHHRRRIVSPQLLDGLARAMKDDARLRIATDHPGYLSWILEHLTRHPDFAWTARGPADWRRRPDDWPATRYEEKAVQAGRRCTYLDHVRRPRGADERQR